MKTALVACEKHDVSPVAKGPDHYARRSARDLVKAGAVTIGKLNATVVEADGTKYTVKGQDEKQKCNCPLFARHRGDIQCKHILAVKLTVNA